MTIVRRTRRIRAAAPARTRYLIAPAGHPNYGDGLIARVWLAHLAAHHPQDRVVLDCHTPGQAAVLLDGVQVERNSLVNRAILDKNVIVQQGAQVGMDLEQDVERGFTVTESGLTVVPKGTVITA